MGSSRRLAHRRGQPSRRLGRSRQGWGSTGRSSHRVQARRAASCRRARGRPRPPGSRAGRRAGPKRKKHRQGPAAAATVTRRPEGEASNLRRRSRARRRPPGTAASRARSFARSRRRKAASPRRARRLPAAPSKSSTGAAGSGHSKELGTPIPSCRTLSASTSVCGGPAAGGGRRGGWRACRHPASVRREAKKIALRRRERDIDRV
jgi:hypothetical protein